MNRSPHEKRPPHGGGPSQSARNKARASAGAPWEETFAEADYLKQLVAEKTPIVVRLRNNEEFTGDLEYYDAHFIRLTRKQEPNLFIYKHEIKYLSERPKTTS